MYRRINLNPKETAKMKKSTHLTWLIAFTAAAICVASSPTFGVLLICEFSGTLNHDAQLHE